ncbi:MAG: SDR family NAD(P)-dependent oxidoreductase [Nitrospirales bacterium]|nr:SDR family NAD(P)-dependent oxidoreductase [Nitrospirales bacterium]MBA3965582.1 SDR family NAD(P)-dependent oxidoreductase [Nitrospirales bacterium]
MSQTVVITGVGPGLGAALVQKFTGEGCRVGMLARSRDYLNQLAEEMKPQRGSVLALPTDITRPEQVKEGFRAVRQAFGPVDMLINHAGNATWAPLQDLTPEQFSEAWRVGPYAGFLCTKEVVQDMVDAGRGVILFSGATSSVRGRGGASAFSSAKFGVRGLAESLARELWPKGIHVAHIVIDGVIGPSDVPKDSAGDKTEPMLQPDSMADVYWHLAMQDKQAWSLEVDLRPYNEEFFV